LILTHLLDAYSTRAKDWNIWLSECIMYSNLLRSMVTTTQEERTIEDRMNEQI
jgi:hypothetical protein